MKRLNKKKLVRKKPQTKKALKKVALIVSRFNSEITEKLLSGCLQRLNEKGWAAQTTVYKVPGAYEIPLVAQALLKKGYRGVVALGAVIRGETSHYQHVCESIERGCTQLQLIYGRPVVFGVLTVENEEQAYDRLGGAHGHKGVDAADVLVEMVQLLDTLS